MLDQGVTHQRIPMPNFSESHFVEPLKASSACS
jgi:hypothetical protein